MERSASARRRFSVRQLIGLTAFVGLLIGNVVLSVRLNSAQSELRRLRRESGVLVVRDPSKVHIVAAPALDVHQWRWRIYVPDGTQLKYGVKIGDVPASGVPDSKKTGLNEFQLSSTNEGELLTLSASRNFEGKQVLAFRGDSFSFFIPVRQEPDEWLIGSSSMATIGTQGQESFDVGQPIVLRRVRLIPDYPEVLGPDETADRGHIVWLETSPRK